MEQIDGMPEGWRLIRITNAPKIGEYALSCAGQVVMVSDPDEWDIACIVERIDPPKPKYRPFANAAEFEPHRNRWWRYKGEYSSKISRPPAQYSEDGHHGFNWEYGFTRKEFDDGTPFGVEVENERYE